MIQVIRSYVAALGASRKFGQSLRLRKKGQKSEALRAAQEALAILSKPYILRRNPAESSILVCATVLVEEVANELGQFGACHRDVTDSLECLRELGEKSEMAEWIPYLEKIQSGRNAV
jgi:hypothetical protein